MGHKNLQGLLPLLCVLCCLSNLKDPGRKERKFNLSHLPSTQTWYIRQDPPSNLVVVFAGVAVSVKRVGQVLGLAFVLVIGSEALCRGGLLMPTGG